MTHRKYDCDGYSMELVADSDHAVIQIASDGGFIEVPWAVMAELCGVISRWECGTIERFKQEEGRMVKYTEFR
jgi:hypothetical protein